MSAEELPEEFLEAARELARQHGPLPERVKVHFLALVAARMRAEGDTTTGFTLDGLAWRTRWTVPLTLDAMANGLDERLFDGFVASASLTAVAASLRNGSASLAGAAGELGRAAVVMRAVASGQVAREVAASDLGVDPGDRRPGGIQQATATLDGSVVLVHLAAVDELLALAWALAVGVDDPMVLMVAAGMSQADAAEQARNLGAACPPADCELAAVPVTRPVVEGVTLTER